MPVQVVHVDPKLLRELNERLGLLDVALYIVAVEIVGKQVKLRSKDAECRLVFREEFQRLFDLVQLSQAQVLILDLGVVAPQMLEIFVVGIPDFGPRPVPLAVNHRTQEMDGGIHRPKCADQLVVGSQVVSRRQPDVSHRSDVLRFSRHLVDRIVGRVDLVDGDEIEALLDYRQDELVLGVLHHKRITVVLTKVVQPDRQLFAAFGE